MTHPAVLPPTDHVARELLKRGARPHALTFLRAAIERDPGERACAALLRAVEARPDASVYGPDVPLDLGLVDGYVRSGMLVEALAVLRGAALDRDAVGAERARMLDELLSPVPPDADHGLIDAYRQICSGGAVLALGMLDERASKTALPPWARTRHEILRRVLLEEAPRLPSQPPPATEDDPSFGTTPAAQILASGIERRDLPGALAELRKHVQAVPADGEAKQCCDSLGRLVAAMLQAEREQAIADRTARTMPMQGHHVGQLQIRMANLAEAERIFRKLVLERPLDQVARQRLDDLQLIRKVVGGPRVSEPGAAPAKPGGGNTLRGLPNAATHPQQAAVSAPRADPFKETAAGAPAARVVTPVPAPVGFEGPPPPEDEMTRPVMLPEARRLHAPGEVEPPEPPEPEVMELPAEPTREVPMAAMIDPRMRKVTSPETLNKKDLKQTFKESSAGYQPGSSGQHPVSDWETEDSTAVLRPDMEAELLLKQGFAQQALASFERLAQSFPDNPRFAVRVEQIKQMIEKNLAPIPAEVTVRRDISDLRQQARPTGMKMEIPQELLARGAAGGFKTEWDDEEPTMVEARRRQIEAERAARASAQVAVVAVPPPPPPPAPVTEAAGPAKASPPGGVRVSRIISIG